MMDSSGKVLYSVGFINGGATSREELQSFVIKMGRFHRLRVGRSLLMSSPSDAVAEPKRSSRLAVEEAAMLTRELKLSQKLLDESQPDRRAAEYNKLRASAGETPPWPFEKTYVLFPAMTRRMRGAAEFPVRALVSWQSCYDKYP
ncbi:hypothetical protein NC653_017040 [Populus alba x Populus x berolinensis]|uniref:Uncharacterized protein n=1 Tax=Populus alba x Populus x berolinensis TaxID=444605 RepID=A0AAD6QP95_9ROSI|nr:hypothetical protein NC653_017040 [Populus alba x Populus x berolinensis]